MEVVMHNSDRVVVMAQGAVIAEGEPHQVRTDQQVIDAYLGETVIDTEHGEETHP